MTRLHLSSKTHSKSMEPMSRKRSSTNDNVQLSNVTVSSCSPRFMELIHSINTFDSNGDANSQEESDMIMALQALVSTMEKLQVS